MKKGVVGIIERKARRDYPLEYHLTTESEAALESHRGYNTVEFAYISTSGGLQKSADIRELPM